MRTYAYDVFFKATISVDVRLESGPNQGNILVLQVDSIP